MAMAEERIRPGSRWVLRRGQHAGTVIEVEGRTFAGAVQYRIVAKGDSTGSSSEDDQGRVHSKRADEFLTLYEPEGRANGHGTQPAFRQRNVPKQRSDEPPLHVVREEGLNVTLMTITPLLAQEWLDRGGLNRHLDLQRVARYAAAMRRGEWQLTGDTVKLDADGLVRDGQHRLEAVVESGVDIQTLVVRNVAEAAFVVMDVGKVRSVADVLGMHGFKYVNGIAGAVRNLIYFEATGRLVATTVEQRALVTTVTALDYTQRHPEVQEVMRVADAVRLVLSGGIGLWAALLVLFGRVDKQLADDFAYKLLNGEELRRGDPILVLRNHLLANTRPFAIGSTYDKEILGASIIKAWNAHRRHERVESWNALTWKNLGRHAEPFPRPDDLEVLF